MIGVIIAVDQEAQQNVAVEYHDSVARRNYRFIDHHKYTLGALGARGALYGCATDRDHPSSLFFKPGEAWGAAADWTAALPMGEDALALALTGGSASRERGADGDTGDERTQSTAIVATSRGYLRFFAESGMQEYVWAFGDQVVCLAGGKSAVLVVHRAMGGALEGELRQLPALLERHEAEEWHS